MIDETTSKEARLEMYRQQVDALEQRVRDLEANLFAATATVASLDAKVRELEGHLAAKCEYHVSLEMYKQQQGRILDLQAKLELLAKYVTSEDGVFCFPDGDMIDTQDGK